MAVLMLVLGVVLWALSMLDWMIRDRHTYRGESRWTDAVSDLSSTLGGLGVTLVTIVILLVTGVLQ